MHFALKLKQYQIDALKALDDFFDETRHANSLNTAFAQHSFKQSPAIQSGVQRAKPYNDIIKGVPSVCLRIPTGGGKTLLGAHAIARVAQRFPKTNQFEGTTTPFVIWLVHTDAILQQTLAALSNPQHPYRQAVEAYFEGRVKVCDMNGLPQISTADFRSHAVILIATIQSFRIEKNKHHMRMVYSFDENYGAHFECVPEALSPHLLTVTAEDITEGSPLRVQDIGKIKHCVVNLLRLLQPILIVDEAHNFYSPQSIQTLTDFWPCAVVELTATPKEGGSNVIYSVSALALKSEQMIKLPIVLANHDTWQYAVNDALLLQTHLETCAADELPDYIRPIVLFQAEPERKATIKNITGDFSDTKNSETKNITVSVLKQYLLEERHINPAWIAVHTGKEKGLTGLNLFDPLCPIRYIITVEALKEGWDCSMAYILCSLQTVNSATDAEQLLGRVLRMPYARARKNAALNKAYAHIVSDKFETTVDRLRERLVEKLGFNKDELGAAFIPAQLDLSGVMLPININSVEFPRALVGLHNTTFVLNQADASKTLSALNALNALPEDEKIRVRISTSLEINTLSTTSTPMQVHIYGAITQTMRDYLHAATTDNTLAQTTVLNERINHHNAIEHTQSAPAQRGVMFAPIPQLCLPLKDGKNRWEVVDANTLQILGQWALPSSHIRLDKYTPSDSTQAQSLDMDPKQERLMTRQYSYQQLALNTVQTTATEFDLIRWLDQQLQNNMDLLQHQTLAYTGAVVRHLQIRHLQTRDLQTNITTATALTLTELERDKVRLANAMHAQIAMLRQNAEQSQFGLAFADMQNSASLESMFQYGFNYQANAYPARNIFTGDYFFNKNFYACIHDLSHKTKAGHFTEEFECLRAIDAHAAVKHWVRNIENQSKYSFWLPTSKGKFYPDFVAELNDGRVLVVEYKGAHLNEPHKKEVGELWERTSNQRCIFIWAVKCDAQGRDVAMQLQVRL